MRNLTSLGLLALALVMIGNCGGGPRVAPVGPGGLMLQPGRYLTAYYRAPEFDPARVSYSLTPFTVETTQGVSAEAFQNLLQEELARAWQANGLKVVPQGEVALTGTVHQVAIRGTGIRFLTGKIWGNLSITGSIARGDQVLFAFQDRVKLTSPVNPGPPAPKENELLLQEAARLFVTHLLNELLLYWPEAEG